VRPPATTTKTAIAALSAFLSACAASPPPAVAPPSSIAPRPASEDGRAGREGRVSPSTPPAETPEPPANTPAEAGPPALVVPGPPALPGPPAEEPSAASGRLAWVNPARCLSSCAFNPGPALVRVNESGAADPRGPFQVHQAALGALRELLAAARTAGHPVKISSAFRPYDEQVRVFRSTKEKGRAARPGHSEHQLGTTIDLRLPTTRAIDWLAAHVAGYGFVLSYPPGKQRVTGYRPEPWHVRFVGRAVAAQVPVGGTLEELFRARPELAESGDCADCPAAASRASCGALTAVGVCTGTVLSWCFDGARAAVDCATFNQLCARDGGNGRPDCVAGPAPTSASGAPP
jgi:D-alanyl-D-alanine carboxypeptidase